MVSKMFDERRLRETSCNVNVSSLIQNTDGIYPIPIVYSDLNRVHRKKQQKSFQKYNEKPNYCSKLEILKKDKNLNCFEEIATDFCGKERVNRNSFSEKSCIIYQSPESQRSTEYSFSADNGSSNNFFLINNNEKRLNNHYPAHKESSPSSMYAFSKYEDTSKKKQNMLFCKKKRTRVIYCHICHQYKPRSTRSRFQVCDHIACYDCVRISFQIENLLKFNAMESKIFNNFVDIFSAHCPFCKKKLDWTKVKPFIVIQDETNKKGQLFSILSEPLATKVFENFFNNSEIIMLLKQKHLSSLDGRQFVSEVQDINFSADSCSKIENLLNLELFNQNFKHHFQSKNKKNIFLDRIKVEKVAKDKIWYDDEGTNNVRNNCNSLALINDIKKANLYKTKLKKNKNSDGNFQYDNLYISKPSYSVMRTLFGYTKNSTDSELNFVNFNYRTEPNQVINEDHVFSMYSNKRIELPLYNDFVTNQSSKNDLYQDLHLLIPGSLSNSNIQNRHSNIMGDCCGEGFYRDLLQDWRNCNISSYRSKY